jgi:pimeloyl-ACP methyl ester carboxylesterase
VIHGDGDAITPLARGRELARLTGAEFVVVPAGGHEPHCRTPDTANRTIERFLAAASSQTG